MGQNTSVSASAHGNASQSAKERQSYLVGIHYQAVEATSKEDAIKQALQAINEGTLRLWAEPDGNQIRIAWHIEDVAEIRPDLSVEQSREVLAAVREEHDAEIGVNWDVIRYHADELFPR